MKKSKYTKAFLNSGNKNTEEKPNQESKEGRTIAEKTKDTVVLSEIKLSSKKKETSSLLSLRYPARLENVLNEIVAARLQKDPSSKENKTSIVVSILEQTLPEIHKMETS